MYYINTKEIMGNKYGTASPVPFRVVDNNIGLDVDISVRCNGEYSYKIVDPLMFYKNVCGNVEEPYTRDKIDSQLKSELLTALQPHSRKFRLWAFAILRCPRTPPMWRRPSTRCFPRNGPICAAFRSRRSA